MSPKTFKAMVVRGTAENKFVRQITQKSLDELPEGGVLIRVHYSSLNYKDALSATGDKGVTKKYPHTPGIDAAGIIEESAVPDFQPGEEVIVTGYDLGSNTSGGFAEYIRVPEGWVVKRPENLSLRESMAYGTAGFTAGLSVYKLMNHGITPDQGPILVTGATGGVGSIAVAILVKAGYHVVAVTGKLEQKQFLIELGAREVIHRDAAKNTSEKPLLSGRWAGAVDTVGGNLLETAIRATKPEGAVACCGNIGSAELHTSIYPFILRGVSLLGIGSAFTPMGIRQQIWKKLSAEWKLEHLDRLTSEITLEQLERHIELILQGKVKGRVIINLLKE